MEAKESEERKSIVSACSHLATAQLIWSGLVFGTGSDLATSVLQCNKHFKRDLCRFTIVYGSAAEPGVLRGRAAGCQGAGAGSVGMVAGLRDKSVVDR